MHKGVVLIVKADNREEAKEKADEFMERYGEGNVWDWYVIGGRWSGTMNEKNNAFNEAVRQKFQPKHDFGYSMQEVEALRPQLQALWEEMGGKGVNTWSRDQYRHEGFPDDILPLSECLAVVKEYGGDPDEKIKGMEERAEEYKQKGDKIMRGYMMRCAGEMLSQNFCFNCNVYNTEEYNYSIPEDPAGFFAVMIDMHN